jgi:hypothetical protein
MSSNINIAVASKSHLLLHRLQPCRQSSPHQKSLVYFEGFRENTETGVPPSDCYLAGDHWGVSHKTVLELPNADSQSKVGFNKHDGEGRKSPSVCPQTHRLKKAGWLTTMMASLAGCFGVLIHEGRQKSKHYLDVPSYQTLISVEKSLDEGQAHIPALTDRYHTSQVAKNQLMAHLNAIALFQPSTQEAVNSDELALRKKLIHSLDHLNYSEADQREIGKLASSIEKWAVKLHEEKASLNIEQLSQKLATVYEKYADDVLGKHLKPEEVRCYKSLADQHLLHIQQENDPNTNTLLYFCLFATGLLSFYRHETADSRRESKINKKT